MQQIERADILRVGMESTGTNVSFPIILTTSSSGRYGSLIPFSLDRGERSSLLPSIGVGMATFMAQLCLTRRLVLDFPCSSQMINSMLPIAEMLYDIRCWRDQLDFDVLARCCPEGQR